MKKFWQVLTARKILNCLLVLLVAFSYLLLPDSALAAPGEGGSSSGGSGGGTFDTAVIDWAIGELCGHMSGHLGGLLTTVAAFGAMVTAAMGAFRAFYGMIITAVGGFSIVAILSFYFPAAVAPCNSGISSSSSASSSTGGSSSAAADVPAPAPAPAVERGLPREWTPSVNLDP